MAEVSRELFESLRLFPGTRREFTVITGSMEPLIRIGEKVSVEIGGELRRYDVVAFWGEGRLTCHVLWHINQQIAKEGEQIYVTCALRRGGKDLAIRASDVLGPVRNFRLGWWDRLRLVWRFRR